MRTLVAALCAFMFAAGCATTKEARPPEPPPAEAKPQPEEQKPPEPPKPEPLTAPRRSRRRSR